MHISKQTNIQNVKFKRKKTYKGDDITSKITIDIIIAIKTQLLKFNITEQVALKRNVLWLRLKDSRSLQPLKSKTMIPEYIDKKLETFYRNFE